jgi:hypothetical protein
LVGCQALIFANLLTGGHSVKKPPVLNFASSINSVNQQKPFFYDTSLNLNLIEINGLRMPFVDLPSISNVELHTKTKAVPREDDDDCMASLELQTKTRVRREDDDDYRLLEMLTKTCAERERDDEE